MSSQDHWSCWYRAQPNTFQGEQALMMRLCAVHALRGHEPHLCAVAPDRSGRACQISQPAMHSTNTPESP